MGTACVGRLRPQQTLIAERAPRLPVKKKKKNLVFISGLMEMPQLSGHPAHSTAAV